MVATGKHLEEVMKEEGVSPKIFARIMGWEKPQAIYRWYYGETLPSIDTLSVLARILNRPIESLLVTREIQI
jgi:transcriptional regulator with XRE-family HTH domain